MIQNSKTCRKYIDKLRWPVKMTSTKLSLPFDGTVNVVEV